MELTQNLSSAWNRSFGDVPPDRVADDRFEPRGHSGFSAIYTPNSAEHTAFIQASLKEGHRVGSYEYMNRVRLHLYATTSPNSALISKRAVWWTPS